MKENLSSYYLVRDYLGFLLFSSVITDNLDLLEWYGHDLKTQIKNGDKITCPQ